MSGAETRIRAWIEYYEKYRGPWGDRLAVSYADAPLFLEDIKAILDRQDESLSSCNCWRCLDETGTTPVGYVLCPTCGNKRCPHIADHRLDCTRSNEPGQPGATRYPQAGKND